MGWTYLLDVLLFPLSEGTLSSSVENKARERAVSDERKGKAELKENAGGADLFCSFLFCSIRHQGTIKGSLSGWEDKEEPDLKN